MTLRAVMSMTRGFFLSNPARLLLEPVLALLAQTLRCPQVRWIWAVGHHCNDVVSGKRRMTGDIQDITERNGSRGRSAGFGDALTWRRRRLAAGNLSSRSTSGSSSLVERGRTRGQGVERAKCCQRQMLAEEGAIAYKSRLTAVFRDPSMSVLRRNNVNVTGSGSKAMLLAQAV